MKKHIALLFLMYICLVTNAQVPTPEICLVTVDETSTHNIVVWERISPAPYDSIKIFYYYNQTPYLLTQQAYSDSTWCKDFDSDPSSGSTTYAITGLLGGVESDTSVKHSTMFLTVTPDVNSVQCQWTRYEGKTVDSYECWRDTLLNDDWESVLSTTNGIPTAWTDNSMPSTIEMEYKLTVTWPNTCSVTKANDFNSSRSNRSGSIANPNLVGVEENGLLDIEMYPNPTSGLLNLNGVSNNGNFLELRVYNNIGKRVASFPFSNVGTTINTSLDLSNLSKGSYLCEIITTKSTLIEKIIIE